MGEGILGVQLPEGGDRATALRMRRRFAELEAAVPPPAARFTDLVGEPAMQYVIRWRMHVAVDALKHEGATVAQLADRLGYRSEAAFARAFKRVVGLPPGKVKRTSEGEPLASAA